MASPVVLSFSGGKDSVLALERLRADGWDVRALLAAVVEDDATLAMHGIPERLVALQAASLGVPLVPFHVPRDAANTVYEARLAAALEPFRAQGVRHVAFGDLFLEDIKAYRDALMARLGFEPVYPLWHEDTRALADRFVAAGYRGVAICVDTSRLGPDWAGRELDASFFAGLPLGQIRAARTASSTPSSTTAPGSSTRSDSSGLPGRLGASSPMRRSDPSREKGAHAVGRLSSAG